MHLCVLLAVADRSPRHKCTIRIYPFKSLQTYHVSLEQCVNIFWDVSTFLAMTIINELALVPHDNNGISCTVILMQIKEASNTGFLSSLRCVTQILF